MSVHVPASRGRTTVSEKSLQRIIEIAVDQVPGTLNQSRFLAQSYPLVNISSISPDADNTEMEVDIRTVVSWPSPVTSVAQTIQRTVAQWLADFAGLTNVSVNVTVDGTETGRSRVTSELLERHDVHPPVTPIHATAANVATPYVRQHTSVTAISVPEPVAVTSIETPQKKKVREISVPEPAQVRSISVPSTQQVRSVSAPKTARVVEVSAPKLAPPRRITAPKPVRLTDIRRSQRKIYSPSVPRVATLKKVRVAPLKVTSPKAPALKLRPVTNPKPTVVKVRSPRPLQVRSARVPRPINVYRPKAPYQAQLRRIEVPQLPDVKVMIPEPTPLLPIEVKPNESI